MLTRTPLAEDLKKTAFREWASESKELARTVVYRKGEFPKADAECSDKEPAALPAGYMDAAHEVANKRVVIAGYRLGDKLKDVLRKP